MRKRRYLYLVIIGLFLGYVTWQSRAFLFSPRLSLDGPPRVSMKAGEEFILRGQTNILAQVSVNGEGIALDAQGNFRQTLLVRPGVLTIQVVAISRFGKERTKTLTLIGM